MGAVAGKTGGLTLLRELHSGESVNWYCAKGMAMTLHLQLIMAQKTQLVPGPAEEKCRVRAGVGIMATGTLTIFKRLVLA